MQLKVDVGSEDESFRLKVVSGEFCFVPKSKICDYRRWTSEISLHQGEWLPSNMNELGIFKTSSCALSGSVSPRSIQNPLNGTCFMVTATLISVKYRSTK